MLQWFYLAKIEILKPKFPPLDADEICILPISASGNLAFFHVPRIRQSPDKFCGFSPELLAG